MNTTMSPVADFIASIDAELAQFLADRQSFVAGLDAELAVATEAIADFVLSGGKRTRPAFAWMGWLGAAPEGDEGASVLRACAALELVHANALIHDDIIDRSDTRRGAPSVHQDFAHRHHLGGFTGDGERFGTAVAILLGDLALAWADDMFHSAGLSAEARSRAHPVWTAMRTEMLGGQLLDVAAEASVRADVADAMRVNRYKTAAYTVERPLHLGATLAGADAELIAAYRGFGIDIGVAFQLRDDLLGVFGDAAVTGKPSGDDLRTGKRTVLIAMSVERADTVAGQHLRSALGTDLSDAEVDELRALITATGAREAIEVRIDQLAERAFSTLDASTATAEAKQRLRDMGYAAVRRDR